MNWLAPVFTRMLTSDVFAKILLKKISGQPARTVKLALQFAFCVALSLIFWLAERDGFESVMVIVLAAGTVNAFAAYAQWRAIDMSLSQSAVFTQGDDIIAILGGQIFLGESQSLSTRVVVGIILIFLAGFILVLSASKREKATRCQKACQQREEALLSFGIMKWIALYSVVWGVAVALLRKFATSGLPLSEFLVAWYLGSVIGAGILLVIVARKQGAGKIGLKGTAAVGVLSVTIWSSMLLNYAALREAPIVVVQPLFQFSEMLLPLLLGLFLFKEVKTLMGREKLAMATGVVGGILIIAGYSL